MGANFAIRKEVFQKVGFFDEYLGPGTEIPASEDVDYKLRMEYYGISMGSSPRAIVYHTFGYRYGLRAIMRHARNYQYGSGGLAAKLTLMKDPRGEQWIRKDIRDCIFGSIRKPYRLPNNINHLINLLHAYNYCLKNYTITQGILSPIKK